MTTHAPIAAWLRQARAFKAELLEGSPFAQMVSQRMQLLGIGDSEAYLEVLRTSPTEVEALADGVAVPESWLFRYPASYLALERHLRQVLMESPVDHQLEMISIGCARGEEPVSMAITARQAGWPAKRIQIMAFDASGVAIAQARAGTYGARAIRERPPWVDDWIDCVDDVIQVSQELLETIDYRHTDVLKDSAGWPARPAVIFCRNILIYLDTVGRARLVARILESSVPGTWLMLGHSEHVDLGGACEPIPAPGAFAWCRVDPTDRDATSSRNPVRQPIPKRIPPGPVRRAPQSERSKTPVSPPVEPLPAVDARGLADRGDLHAARAPRASRSKSTDLMPTHWRCSGVSRWPWERWTKPDNYFARQYTSIPDTRRLDCNWDC